MGFFNNVLNGVIDIVKIVLIAIVCFVIILIGGYLLADYVGLVPEATGYHRSLSLQTFLTDMPFIGNNMVYLILVMALLLLAVIGIELYNRKVSAIRKDEPEADIQGHQDIQDKQDKKEFEGAADKNAGIMAEPDTPKNQQ